MSSQVWVCRKQHSEPHTHNTHTHEQAAARGVAGRGENDLRTLAECGDALIAFAEGTYVEPGWVMSHVWRSHVTRVKESCRTCEGIMSHQLKESCRTCEGVMSYIYIHARGGSCHTCEGVMTKYLLMCPRVSGWVMSHVWRCHDKTSTYLPKGEWVSHVTRVRESWHISTYVHVCRVWHHDESSHICDGVVTKIYIRRVCMCVYICVTFCIYVCDMTHTYIYVCMYVCMYIDMCTCIYTYTQTHTWIQLWLMETDIGWLRLVGSLKLEVSFAEYHLFNRALFQMRPTVLRILLILATP